MSDEADQVKSITDELNINAGVADGTESRGHNRTELPDVNIAPTFPDEQSAPQEMKMEILQEKQHKQNQKKNKIAILDQPLPEQQSRSQDENMEEKNLLNHGQDGQDDSIKILNIEQTIGLNTLKSPGGAVELPYINDNNNITDSKEQLLSNKSVDRNIVNLGDQLHVSMSATMKNSMRNKRNSRFREFSQLFEDLTVSRKFETDDLEILEVIISSKSTHFLALLKNDFDTLFRIQIYNTSDMKLETTLDIKGTLINAEHITQNEEGDRFVVSYNDNGDLHLYIFDSQKMITDFHVNKSFSQLQGFNIEALEDMNNSMAVTCFTNNHTLFCSFYKNDIKTEYHFKYDMEAQKTSDLISHTLDCKNKNFPVNCFYVKTEDIQEVHVFYRQKGLFLISAEDVSKFEYEIQEDGSGDFSEMFLWRSQVLVLKSSQYIHFLKYGYNILEDRVMWYCYHEFESRGFLSGSSKLPTFQVIEDDFILFYEIDTETLEPSRINVMINFLDCSMARFGDQGKYAVTYKSNEPDFFLFSQKYRHDFKIHTCTDSHEGGYGLSVNQVNQFLVANQGKLSSYYDQKYKEKGVIADFRALTNKKKNDNVPRQILFMTSNESGNLVALVVGQALLTGIELVEYIYILELKKGQYHIMHTIDMIMETMKDVSMKFWFNKLSNDSLLFANQHEMIEYNYITHQKSILCTLINLNLEEQPEYYRFNDKQTECVICTRENILHVNLITKEQTDLDEILGINSVKNIIFDEGNFYILANKRQRKLGFILLKYPESYSIKHLEDDVKKEEMFLINYKNKLDIDDVDMFVLKESDQKHKLVIAYKTIYINIYTIQVIDLETQKLLYKHESSCLWETKISGFINNSTNDFISLDQTGIGIMALSTAFNLKDVKNYYNTTQFKLHSMSSCDYLQLDETNNLFFQFANEENKIIQVQSMYKDEAGDTEYFDIYKVKMTTCTLRELLQLQSVYYCDTPNDVQRLLAMQERFDIFYQSFLELDRRNLVSILAFDSKTMNLLLHEDRADYFDEDFPIFYRNKHGTKGMNAIDVALSNNQIGAINKIIDHVVNYQNNYISFFLFKENLTRLLDYEVDLIELFKSDVFSYTLEFDHWPSVHSNTKKMLKGYNGSIFDLRAKYSEIFPDVEDANLEEADKMYKITYRLNLLSNISEPDDIDDFMNLMAEQTDGEQLPVFQSQILNDHVDFKWGAYGFFFPLMGSFFHLFYIIVITIYVELAYNIEDQRKYGVFRPMNEDEDVYQILLVAGIAYPLCYDLIQMMKNPTDYFKDPWNYTDITFGFLGVLNIVFQRMYKSDHIACIASMTGVIILALIKTNFYMRSLRIFAPLVVLLETVIRDLNAFLIFYILLLYQFDLIFGVIGYQNFFKSKYNDFEDYKLTLRTDSANEYPGAEYREIGHFLGNLVAVWRMSMGDNDVGAVNYMTPERQVLFWIVWLLVCFLLFIIFFNFVIAEASQSYNKVQENLDNILVNVRIQLVNETEDMMPKIFKTKKRFPAYIISREASS